MKQLLISLILLITMGCSPFHELAKKTEIGTADGYVSVTNSKVKFKALTYGDFNFAKSNKEYKKLKTEGPTFDNILLYATTVNPSYEYFVLLDPIDTNFNLKKYEVKNTFKDNHRFVLLITLEAPFGDAKFLNTNFVID